MTEQHRRVGTHSASNRLPASRAGTSTCFWRNRSGSRHDAPQRLTEAPANIQLRNPGTQLADMTCAAAWTFSSQTTRVTSP